MLTNNIYLSWRRKPNESRLIIGKINRHKGGGIIFNYIDTEFEKAKKLGLSYFTGFREVNNLLPMDTEKQLSAHRAAMRRKWR